MRCGYPWAGSIHTLSGRTGYRRGEEGSEIRSLSVILLKLRDRRIGGSSTPREYDHPFLPLVLWQQAYNSHAPRLP